MTEEPPDRAARRGGHPVLPSLTRPYVFNAAAQLPPETVITPTTVEAMPDVGARWHTYPVQRTVLVAAHTVTSLMRIEDIVELIEQDPRVQLVFTKVPDRLGHDVDQRLNQREVRVVPWSEAVRREDFDLVVSASLHQLEDVTAAARFAAPHGAGFNKLWPTWAWPGPDDTRPVYGLDRASLLDDDGRPILDALLLPHADHLQTLRRQCPEAERSAVVCGDPCYDRLVECRLQRERYREQLGVRCGQVLVAVASTWGPHALLAKQLDRLRSLPSEVPSDHRVIATMHPAVWAEHGARQVRSWLRTVRDAGVDLVDAGEDWRGLIAAADTLIADHSSLTVYAASIGVPVLLSHFADGEVDPSSIVAAIARESPRLCPETPLFAQLFAARAAQVAQWGVAHARVAARQGKSAEIIRETLYRLLRLPEPNYPAKWPSVPAPRLVQDGSRPLPAR